MAHVRNAIMEEHRASMQIYKKVHKETVRSELRMVIVQQSLEMIIYNVKKVLAHRREQMGIRAYRVEEEWKRMRSVSTTAETSDGNKKNTEKGVSKDLTICKGSRLGLEHCVANEKRKKRKRPFVWKKSKSCVVIEVGQTDAIDAGLNCVNRLANYEQPCQHAVPTLSDV
ncbi:hypothetical protein Tco_0011469 [Tanacetum coccineum]